MYHHPSDEIFLLVAYGPIAFLITGIYMALFGGSILASKLAGLVSAALGIIFGAVLAKRDAWARIAGCMREEAGSVVGSVIV